MRLRLEIGWGEGYQIVGFEQRFAQGGFLGGRVEDEDASLAFFEARCCSGPGRPIGRREVHHHGRAAVAAQHLMDAFGWCPQRGFALAAPFFDWADVHHLGVNHKFGALQPLPQVDLRQMGHSRSYTLLLPDVHVLYFAHGDTSAMDPTVREEHCLLARTKGFGRVGGNRDHLAAQIFKHRFDTQTHGRDAPPLAFHSAVRQVPRSTMVPLKIKLDERTRPRIDDIKDLLGVHG